MTNTNTHINEHSQPQLSIFNNITPVQIMSPDTDKHTFISLLDGPETFNDWLDEFEGVVQLYYPALEAYLVDENNLIFDKNLNIIQDERHMRIMLGNYKAIINGLLARSLTNSTFTKLKIATSKFKKEQHYAKLVFNYIQSHFGKITFKQLIDVFENYTTLNITDSVEIVNQWNNIKNLLSNPMYPLYLLFSKYPKEVQEKLLDMFGLLTTIDEYTFRSFAIDLCEEFTSKSKACKAANNKTKRQPCLICTVHRWRHDFPKQKFKYKCQKVRDVTTNKNFEPNMEAHENHFSNLCINEAELNAEPKCHLATYLPNDKGSEKKENNWYIVVPLIIWFLIWTLS